MMSEATKTKFDVNQETAELTIERVIHAPRERVFKAWSDSEMLKQWWGPRVFPTTYSDLDFREGGYWHYCMTGPDGTEAWGKMMYDEINEPERIVYTDHFSDKDGGFNDQLPTMQITITLEDLGDGTTRLKSYSKLASVDDLNKLVEMGMREGIIETWDKLDELLSGK
jgi:uncharacterized protein YndB with AHSA1/START domain